MIDRGRGPADGGGAGRDCLPDGALGHHLPGAGLGGRLRRLLGNAHDPDSAGLGPQPCMDDLAGRRRLAHAGLGDPSPGGMKA
jgi:hypothetical protein